MKLKKAFKIARKRGLNYLDIDSHNEIYGHKQEPGYVTMFSQEYIIYRGKRPYLGTYTGKKFRARTIHKVPEKKS